jgi:hypothetical protein
VDERTEYRLRTGREPVERFSEDHPDRWQWDYRGGSDERETLLERLFDKPLESVGDQPALF